MAHVLCAMLFLRALSVAVVAAGTSKSARRGDGTIYMIRHGEKTDKGDLSIQGLYRAQHLQAIFNGNGGSYTKPDALFAGHYDEPEPQRTLHTLAPVGRALGRSIDNSIENSQTSRAAAKFLSEINDNNKVVVLAAWNHCWMQDVCEGLAPGKCSALFSEVVPGITSEAPHCHGSDGNPESWWPDDDFDSVLVFTVTNGKVSVTREAEGISLGQSSPSTLQSKKFLVRAMAEAEHNRNHHQHNHQRKQSRYAEVSSHAEAEEVSSHDVLVQR